MLPNRGDQTSRHARRSSHLIIFFSALVLAGGLSLLYRLSQPDHYYSAGAPESGKNVHVKTIHDGDTFTLSAGPTIRLIGVDALDSHNSKRMLEQSKQLGMDIHDVKHWSNRATGWLTNMLEDKNVILEYGPDRTDDYGRLLAYVRVQTEEKTIHINRRLIEKGLATATRHFLHPRRKTFIRLEHKARQSNKGLWQDATRHYR